MSRIFELKATVSVANEADRDEISMAFLTFLYNEVPHHLTNNENYTVLDSNVDVLFDN